uniref:Uncharacterized protein n=1 Tax=Theileria annulata TaxID=5874 RepID=A0A3B0NCT4_THEAN
MVVYDNHILWHRGYRLYESFCCAILNYYYKHKDALFSNIVKTTQSDIPYVKNSCPDLDDAIEDAFHRLNVLHQHLYSLTEERSQPETSTDGNQPSDVPIITSETVPTIGTGETTDSTEESNLSQPEANSDQSQPETQDQTESLIPTSIQPEEQQERTPGTQEQQNQEEIHEQESFSTPIGNLSQEPTNEEQSQLETEDNTQSNDQSETCTIPNDSTLNGLYP